MVPTVSQTEWVKRTNDVRDWLKANRGALAPAVYTEIRNLIKLGATHINERPSLLIDIEDKLTLYVSENQDGQRLTPLVDNDPDFYERLVDWMTTKKAKIDNERERVRSCNTIIRGKFHQGSAAKYHVKPPPGQAKPVSSAPQLPPLSRNGTSFRRRSLTGATGSSGKGMTRSASDTGLSNLSHSHPPTAAGGSSSNLTKTPNRSSGYGRSGAPASASSRKSGSTGRRSQSVPPLGDNDTRRGAGTNTGRQGYTSASPSRASSITSVPHSTSKRKARKSGSAKKKTSKKDRVAAALIAAEEEARRAQAAQVAAAPEEVVEEDLVTEEQIHQFQNWRERFSLSLEQISALANSFREESRDEDNIVTRVLPEDQFVKCVASIGITDPRRAASIYSSYPKDRLYGMVDWREFCADLAFLSTAPVDERTKTAFHIYDLDGDGLLMHSELHSLLDRVVLNARRPASPNASNTDGDEEASADLVRAIDMMFGSVDRDRDMRISFSEFTESFIDFKFIGQHLSPRFQAEPLSQVRGARQHLILEAMEEGRVVQAEKEATARRDAAYLRKLNFHFAPQSTERQGVYVVSENASDYGVHQYPLSAETKGVHFVVGKSPSRVRTELLYIKFDRSVFSEVEAATWWALHGRRFLENSYFETRLCGTRQDSTLGKGNNTTVNEEEHDDDSDHDFDDTLSDDSDDEYDTGLDYNSPTKALSDKENSVADHPLALTGIHSPVVTVAARKFVDSVSSPARSILGAN